MMRKHINSIETNKEKENLPFFAWQCITLKLENRNIDLVILDEKEMFMLLRFLLLSLKSIDGFKNSAQPILNDMIFSFKEQKSLKQIKNLP